MYKQLSIFLLSSTITGISWMGYHSHNQLAPNLKIFRHSRTVDESLLTYTGNSRVKCAEQPATTNSDTGILPLATAVLMLQDPDWQFITVQKMLAFDRFVKSHIALQQFDFSNAAQVANVLERTAEQV